jgi:hypothetical protein
MPRWQFDFPNGTPWLLKLLFAFFFANFMGLFATTLWAEHYGQRQPSPVSPFPIQFKGGLVVFVPRWLGVYDQWSLWLHFAFLGILGLMLWRYRRQAVRVS